MIAAVEGSRPGDLLREALERLVADRLSDDRWVAERLLPHVERVERVAKRGVSWDDLSPGADGGTER